MTRSTHAGSPCAVVCTQDGRSCSQSRTRAWIDISGARSGASGDSGSAGGAQRWELSVAFSSISGKADSAKARDQVMRPTV